MPALAYYLYNSVALDIVILAPSLCNFNYSYVSLVITTGAWKIDHL
jgi:hypothetical protein